MTAWLWRALVTRLAWVSSTPLGRPVVPLEYGRAARSPGSTATSHRRVLVGDQLPERGRAVGLAEDEHLLDPRLPGRRQRLLGERRDGDEQAGAGVGQLVGQLAGREQRVGAGDDAPGGHGAVRGQRRTRAGWGWPGRAHRPCRSRGRPGRRRPAPPRPRAAGSRASGRWPRRPGPASRRARPPAPARTPGRWCRRPPPREGRCARCVCRSWWLLSSIPCRSPPTVASHRVPTISPSCS